MADLLCERTRAALSAAADGEPAEVDHEHVAGCPGCSSFDAGVRSLRSRLRFEVLDGAPDVAPRVLEAVSSQPLARRWLPTAAALVAGVVLGAAFVWPSGGDDVAVASLPARVVAAQHDVASVSAQLTITDPTETRTGTLRYRAPETLELRVGKHVLSVGDGGEPFAGDAPVALDLVLPVAGFTGAAGPASLGSRTLDGRPAIGVRVTAAQVDALLTGLQLGAESEVHATDPVDLWLDRDHLVPLSVIVRAAAGPDRARWAAARGGADAGDVVLEAHLSDVVVNDARTVDGLQPAPADVRSSYRDGAPTGPAPSWLPSGMAPWRAGTMDDVSIATWTDGRAWIKVRSTTAWAGTHLFGDVGRAVRPVRLGDGVGYAAEGGNAVAVHGDDVDVVVTGSVGPAVLRRVATSLGVTGRRVPATWDEASTATIGEVAARLDVLVLPDDTGFAPPAARLDGDTASLVFTGPGERLLTLVTRPGSALTPPLDPDAVGVVVRGHDARWSPARGDLEWAEGGQVWSLRTTTIGLGELVGLANRLVAS
ncbi:MAG TPA: hypothetical protein VFU93_02580 [Acidimicrobiales bacterium]|nr:hypothetical protein [Acidimicrobiales bacterium]